MSDNLYKKQLMLILDYEVRSSWWACHISNDFFLTYVAKYYVWKSRIKTDRYLRSRSIANELNFKAM